MSSSAAEDMEGAAGNPPPPTTVILPTIADIRYHTGGKFMNYLWWGIVILTLFATGILFAKLGNAMNTNFMYTYDLPSNNPGSLKSTRGSFYWWILVISICLDILMVGFGFVYMFIPWDGVVGLLHPLFTGLTVIVEFILIIEIGILAGQCNKDTTNPCTHPLFCAATAVVNDPVATPQTCPTPDAAYSISIAKVNLSWNPIFTTNMALVITLIVLSIIIFILSLIVSMNRDLVYNKYTKIWATDQNVYSEIDEDIIGTTDVIADTTTSTMTTEEGEVVVPNNVLNPLTLLNKNTGAPIDPQTAVPSSPPSSKLPPPSRPVAAKNPPATRMGRNVANNSRVLVGSHYQPPSRNGRGGSRGLLVRAGMTAGKRQE